MQVIELNLDLRRGCLDYERNILLNIEGQAAIIKPYLHLWFKYEDIQFVFKAKNGADYLAVVPKAASNGKAHKSARSIDNFLQQTLKAVDGKGRDLAVHEILGIKSSGKKLAEAQYRLNTKQWTKDRNETRAKKAKIQAQLAALRKPRGDGAARTTEDIEVDGQIAELEQEHQALEEPEHPEEDAEDIQDDNEPQVRSIFFYLVGQGTIQAIYLTRRSMF